MFENLILNNPQEVINRINHISSILGRYYSYNSSDFEFIRSFKVLVLDTRKTVRYRKRRMLTTLDQSKKQVGAAAYNNTALS